MEAQFYIYLFKALTRKIQFSTNLEQDKAIQVALTLIQEISKDRRAEEMKAEWEKAKEEPSTARQLAYAKILGIKVDNGLTKREASKLIEQANLFDRQNKERARLTLSLTKNGR